MPANRSVGLAAALAAALVTAAPGTSAVAVDAAALPRSKVKLEACFRAATTLHPGTVERVGVRHQGEAFFFWLETRERHGREWIDICDGTTGLIVQEQQLIDITP